MTRLILSLLAACVVAWSQITSIPATGGAPGGSVGGASAVTSAGKIQVGTAAGVIGDSSSTIGVVKLTAGVPGAAAYGEVVGLWTACTGYLKSDGTCSTPPSTTVEDVIFRTLCQNTVAGSNFSTPAANAPTFACVTGANAGDASAVATAWNFGVLSFAENVSEATSGSVQGAIPLPSTWVAASGITVDIVWRTAATSGDVVWKLQGQCVADGEVPGNFSAAVAFTADTAKGTTLQFNDVAQKTLTTADVLSGCAAGETFLFRLFRDATVAGDTLADSASLITAKFGVTK